MRASSTTKKKSFRSKLKRIAVGMEYYAVAVPEKTTLALGTRGPVPVSARVNGSEPFLASFYPVGGGRDYLRIRNKICKSVEIQAGDTVRVDFSIRDRSTEIAPPRDLLKALKEKGLNQAFKALPIGKKSFLLRKIDEAVQPQTRAKRIQETVQETQNQSGKEKRKR